MSSFATTSEAALVTGATSGIGHEFARQLARRGHDLILVARDAARLADVATELRAAYAVAVEVLPADLTDPAQLAAVEVRVADRDRPVGLLVNNAGRGLRGRFLDHDVEEEAQLLALLVTAVLRLSHAALGAMAERGRGGVINVSSVASFLPAGTYSAAKAWVNSFGEWAANEYRSQGVTVTTLCPGFTRTEMHERMGARRSPAPDFLWLEPDFLVTRALEDYDRGRVLSIPGVQYKLISGLARAVPAPVLQRLRRRGR